MKTQKQTEMLAWALTISLSVVAAMSGWGRGVTAPEKFVWAGLSVLILLVTHLMPSLVWSKTWLIRALVLPVWVVSFAVSTLQGADLFTRINNSHQPEVEVASTYEGRPVAEITAELKKATLMLPKLPEWKRGAQEKTIEILQGELNRANKFEERFEEKKVKAQADPLGFVIASFFDSSADKVMLVISVATTFSLESAAIVLWLLGSQADSVPEGKNPKGYGVDFSPNIHGNIQEQQVVVTETVTTHKSLTNTKIAENIQPIQAVSVEETEGVVQSGNVPVEGLSSESMKLMLWLQTTTSQEKSLRRIITSGPRALRNRSIAEKALMQLEERQYVRIEGGNITTEGCQKL